MLGWKNEKLWVSVGSTLALGLQLGTLDQTEKHTFSIMGKKQKTKFQLVEPGAQLSIFR